VSKGEILFSPTGITKHQKLHAAAARVCLFVCVCVCMRVRVRCVNTRMRQHASIAV
jgi:hypothetical protein